MSDPLTPAFVLHSRKYGENHLLMDMLTYADGRLSLMVRGAAAAKSTRRGMLQPFNLLRIAYSGKGDILNLKQIEQQQTYVLPQGKALYSGFYLNELITRLIATKEPVPLLFDAYSSSIFRLKQAQELDGILRDFELELLQTLGYGIDLLHEGESGKEIQANVVYGYELEKGLVPMPAGSNYLIGGDTLHALAQREPMTTHQNREAKALMRHILKFYLGDKPLKSRELFLRKF